MPASLSLSSRIPAPVLLLMWLLTALAFLAKAFVLTPSVPLILDSDDAMRLVEVQDLLAGQGWFDLVQHRLGVPDGVLMHWSRLIDLPEAALLVVLRPFAGAFAPTLLAIIWPLLLIGPLYWLTTRLATALGARPLWPLLLLVPTGLISLGEFVPGRVDHHSAQILFTLAMVAFLLEGFAQPRRAALAGLCGAACLTIGMEGLPLVAAAGLGAGLAAVARPETGPAFRDFALGLATCVVLGLGLTIAPADWLTPRLDAISIVVVVAAIGAALVAILFTQLPLRRPLARVLALGAMGAVLLAVLLVLFPALRYGPYAALDPWLVQNWLLRIAESQSLTMSLAADPVYPIAVGVPVVLAIVAALLVARTDRTRRLPLLVYALLLGVGALVMVVQIRAARIVAPLAIPGDVLLIGAALARARAHKGLMPAIGVVGGFIATSGLVLAVLATLLPAPETVGLSGDRQACLRPGAFAALASLPPARTMTPIDLGAHVLLYTSNSVVSAPYHRGQSGLRDTYRFFNDPPATARAIAKARGLTRLVTCDGLPEVHGLAERAADSLVNQLAAGTLPDWITPVPSAGPLTIYTLSP